MIKILFVGNYLSLTHGSKAVSESIAEGLSNDQISIMLTSRIENKYARFIQILYASVFYDYSIIHIDVFSGNSFLFARIAATVGKLRSKKIILTLHGGALYEYYTGREKLFGNLFRDAYVQSPSMFLRDFFADRQLNVTYCPNPVFLSKFRFGRTHVKKNSLLWVRAFSKEYNPHVPVMVLEKVLIDFSDATLTMIGPDRGLMNEVKDLIQKRGLEEKVSILGAVQNDQLSQYYQTHAVYLNTTSYESFGMGLLEAASCGIPMVSFNVGEIPRIWTDEKDILLCKPGDVEKMAAQTHRILINDSLGTKLSRGGRETSATFSWDIIKERWELLISRMT